MTTCTEFGLSSSKVQYPHIGICGQEANQVQIAELLRVYNFLRDKSIQRN